MVLGVKPHMDFNRCIPNTLNYNTNCMDNGKMNWINEPTDITDWYGFVYEIKNLINKRKYIGKKFFWTTKTLPPKKGNKNKRHKKVESDWRTYWGSCRELLDDVEKLGKGKFKREIIRLCKTKWECAYYEAELQFVNKVLFKPEYYNGIINCRLRKPKKYRGSKNGYGK